MRLLLICISMILIGSVSLAAFQNLPTFATQNPPGHTREVRLSHLPGPQGSPSNRTCGAWIDADTVLGLDARGHNDLGLERLFLVTLCPNAHSEYQIEMRPSPTLQSGHVRLQV
jgi:hypothetical protein